MTEDLSRHTRAAARAISGDDEPSEWLSHTAHRVTSTILVGLVRHEKAQPKRVEVRRRIKAVRAAAQLILDEFYVSMNGVPLVSDPKKFPVRDYLLSAYEHCNQLDGELPRNLRLLIDKCDAGLDAVPAKGGRGHPLPNDVADATAGGGIMCALAVSLLWQHVNGKLPPIDSDRAWRACVEFWRGAGGGHLRGEGSGWRRDLQEARKERYRREDAFLAAMFGVNRIHP